MTHKERRVLIKTNAKARLRSSSSNPYLATLIMYGVMLGIIILAVISVVIPMIMGAAMSNPAVNNPFGVMLILGANISNNVLNIVIQILFSVLLIGFSWYTLKIYREEENKYSNIFSGFGIRGFWTICARILVAFFVGIFVFAAALIVIIPMLIAVFVGVSKNVSEAQIFTGTLIAIIAIWILSIPAYIFSYGFRLINYIMYDDRNINAFRVLFKSWKMMKGHKWELFKLDLTFIGWEFISVFTLGIAGIYTIPYFYTVYAGFYEEIKEEYND